MAAAHFAQMGSVPNMLRSDLEMDTYFDFNQGAQQSGTPSRLSTQAGPSTQQVTTPSSYDDADDRQVFAGPSHEYDRFKQQTGVHVGDVTGFSHLNQPLSQSFGGGFNSGIDEMNFQTGTTGWSTGLDMDADMNMDFGSTMPTAFYPADTANPHSQDFVDPTSIDGENEPQSNVGRLWPGMHSQQAQQAAMAKSRSQQQRQQQMQQMQRQQQLQHQQQQQQQLLHQQQQQQQGKGKQRAAPYQADPHTEESISRLLNQMRQNSHVSMPEDDGGDYLPNVARMKKDEDEMDEDERLLASEEGKKLSSKERRQLRNKVSARAFRSRRKEYIGQLEGEVAVKVQEASGLKSENNALIEENERYRALIQTLLRHPSFTPFIEDLSKDPAFIAVGPTHIRQHQQQQQQQQARSRATSRATTPVPSNVQAHEVKPQMNQQHLQVPAKREVHRSSISSMGSPVDVSMLNISNGANFAMQQQQQLQQQQHQQQLQQQQQQQQLQHHHQQGMPFDFQQPQIFAAQIPQGPSPLDLALDLVKQSRRDVEDFPSFDGAQW